VIVSLILRKEAYSTRSKNQQRGLIHALCGENAMGLLQQKVSATPGQIQDLGSPRMIRPFCWEGSEETLPKQRKEKVTQVPSKNPRSKDDMQRRSISSKKKKN